ncbi:glycoside hydrolase superfamily [Suillus clintonianus]|uniref:glycoside hydrolase superfamily n=1 Tax=Suillus clintonianus TaxID=1904413 RepID=UPI001B86C927|nr:glycoside hydrolase superfamily [Suillus clintonianus]KAG2152804.1 glycoside hydrolase superfamily [Suillus clintonianus]
MNLSDEDKREIGQHFVFGFHGHEISEDAKELIEKYHVGNIILMKRNVQSVKQVHALVQSLQQCARDAGHAHPLMIGIDQENGLVSAFSSTAKYQAGTQFPGAMAIAATGDPKYAKECSEASAREMKAVGINWSYSPVGDVNSDPQNPVIGVRSFGDDPTKVARYAKAVGDGLTQGGVAPSAKHFPGHGDTNIDSHLGLPVIKKSRIELDQTELKPFKELIDAGIASIMTGHMVIQALTGDSETPASLSRAVTTTLLREELHFEGVVVTDCLEMNAVKERQGGVPRGAVEALAAGADVVMVCHTMALHRGAMEATYEAVQKAELNMDELRKSGERIIALKREFAGTWDDVLGKPFDEKAMNALQATNKKLSKEAYAKSTALISGSLPVFSSGKIVVMTPVVESLNAAVDDAEGVQRTDNGHVRNTAAPYYMSFAESVQRRTADVEHLVYAADFDCRRDFGEGIVFVTRNADRGAWQLDVLERVRTQASGVPVVVLASCAPYELFSRRVLGVQACVASFEYTSEALEAAAKVIFDGISPVGESPVSNIRGQ